MSKAEFGMVGLGTMGRNFLLNVAEQGFSGVGYNKHRDKLDLLMAERADLPVTGVDNVADLIAGLETPRRIMMLVPAGDAVDSVIADLLPHLDPGDIVIDGGNSHYSDTERREAFLGEKGIGFLGVGVSGGEEGARNGASIMAGGRPEVYEHVRPIFEAASAKVNGAPCAAHVGNGSAGHFVKMVHNGIEYGLMQLIAETYDLLKRGYGKTDLEIADIFAEWNSGELNSFLIEITSIVLRKKDDDGTPLVEKILDTAGQKGTGKWTSQTAMDLGVPIPTIDSAVTMRQISARKTERVAANAKMPTYSVQTAQVDDEHKRVAVHLTTESLYVGFLAAFAQGISLLSEASVEKNYDLDLDEIVKIWRGGCIIRAALLEDIRTALVTMSEADNILFSDTLGPAVAAKRGSLMAFDAFASAADIPSMAFAATRNYIRALSTVRLPANLIQAQRDYFGAHTYQRVDKEGTFHTADWETS
jgi:6-phosphogluconate dehydrogenase